MNRDYTQVNQSTICDEPSPEERRRAVRSVAAAARDTWDCAMLLDALGLSAEDGLRTETRYDSEIPYDAVPSKAS